MILQALVHCYEALAERGELEKPGWSPMKVSWGLELDEDGQEREAGTNARMLCGVRAEASGHLEGCASPNG